MPHHAIFTLLFVLSFLLHRAQDCNRLLEAYNNAGNRPVEQKRRELFQIIAVSGGNDSCKANAYRRMGTLYKNTGRLDSAFFYFTRGLQLAHKINDTLSTASSNNQLGLLYTELENWPAAGIYFTN